MKSHKKNKKKNKKKAKKQEDDEFNALFPEEEIKADNTEKQLEDNSTKAQTQQSVQPQPQTEEQPQPQSQSQPITQSSPKLDTSNPNSNPKPEYSTNTQAHTHTYYNKLPVISPNYTDSDNSEDEGMEYYKEGGYHPVHVGEVLLDRYIILQKLGWGHFSTVWLSKDMKYNTHVAIKIQKSSQHYLDAAYDEVEILQELDKHNFDPEWVDSVKQFWKDNPLKISNGIERDHSQLVQLLNSFIHHGPNGKHFCMVFEIMGITLLDIIKQFNYKGIPIPYVRIIAKQILIGLDFLHRMCGIIHTDLKPENVLVCLTKEELKEIEETGTLNDNKKKNKVKSLFNRIGGDGGSEEHDGDDGEGNGMKEVNQNASKIDQLSITDQQSLSFIKDSVSVSDHNSSIYNNNNSNSNGVNISTTNGSMGKKKRKKNQKFKKAQAKKLTKMGFSQEEITKALNRIMQRKKERESNNASILQIDNLIKEGLHNKSKSKSNLSNNDQRDIIRSKSIPHKSKIKLNESLNNQKRASSFSLLKAVNQNENYNRKRSNDQSQLLQSISFSLPKHNQNIHKPKKNKKNKENLNLKVKICDMGNACWFNHHFSTEIQTRQYRSPEVILGVNYNESADLWSLACIIFELVTGDFLFDPRVGDTYTKNDDHLAQIIELLGRMPRKFAFSGLNSKKYFNKEGNMIRIKGLQHWPLKSVLMHKYKINEKESQALSDFLMPMLEYYPERRASAQSMLSHPWLTMKPYYDYYMNDLHYEGMLMLKRREKKKEEERLEKDTVESDEERNMADNEDNSNCDEGDWNMRMNRNLNGYDFGGDDGDRSDEDSLEYDTQDMIMLQNFNNSFAAYGQHIDLAILDRANPQFTTDINAKSNANIIP